MLFDPVEKMWKSWQSLLDAVEIDSKAAPEGQCTEFEIVSEVLFLAVEVMYLSFPKCNLKLNTTNVNILIALFHSKPNNVSE